MPVVSMMIASSASSPARTRAQSRFKLDEILRTAQQMQPFSVSTIRSSEVVAPATADEMERVVVGGKAMSLSSIETSPNSFSTIAIRLPCVAERMWLSSVVLPAPRKPVRTVTGTRSSREVVPPPLGAVVALMPVRRRQRGGEAAATNFQPQSRRISRAFREV